MRKNMRNNLSFEKLEDVLGFCLKDEQKKVLNTPAIFLWDMEATIERCTGSTTAAVLKLLLDEGKTPIFLPNSLNQLCCLPEDDFFIVKACCHYSGDDKKRVRYFSFCDYTIKIGQKLSAAGINVREIWWNGHCTINLTKTDIELTAGADITELVKLEETIDRLTQKAIHLNEILQETKLLNI